MKQNKAMRKSRRIKAVKLTHCTLIDMQLSQHEKYTATISFYCNAVK